jgi:hypothetical protein
MTDNEKIQSRVFGQIGNTQDLWTFLASANPADGDKNCPHLMRAPRPRGSNGVLGARKD